MPGLRGKKNVGRNIKEFRRGKTFARTKRKFGAKRAQKQAVAVGLRMAGVPRKRKRRSRRTTK